MFKIYDLYLLAPELSLTLLALVVMAVDLFAKRRIATVGTALVGLLVPAAFAISQAVNGINEKAFFGMLVVDPYAIFFKIVFLLIAAIMILSSYDYVGKYVRAEGEFYVLMLFSVVGMMMMASSGELITDRKSTRLNSSHSQISYAVFCLKKKNEH